jgi:phosphoglycolate phosphatase-like HAD superfamily hydrolase
MVKVAVFDLDGTLIDKKILSALAPGRPGASSLVACQPASEG